MKRLHILVIYVANNLLEKEVYRNTFGLSMIMFNTHVVNVTNNFHRSVI